MNLLLPTIRADAVADNWNHSPDVIDLGAGNAHVWRASLDQNVKVIANLAALLSRDERQRAARFHRSVDRDRFIVGRGILRKIISAYLALAPCELQFTHNEYGKPAVSEDQNDFALNFNLSHLIRAFAYMGGNLAMSLDASDVVYQWDPQTMGEIMTSGAEPFYTVILAIVIMTIAGLSLWMSPVIAYKVAMGQVYESVSSTVSGWAGALVGAGIELYSSAIAASISNQAERAQAQGQFMGELTRAGTAYDVGKLNALANRIRGITGIEGNRISSVEGIYGGIVRAAGAINTERLYANESAAALARLNARDIWARNDQAIGDLNAERKQQSANLETDRAADTQNWAGGKIIKGSEWLGGAVRTGLSDSQTGRQTLQGRIAGSTCRQTGKPTTAQSKPPRKCAMRPSRRLGCALSQL